MNVLSLFDGISCGMEALHRLGIPVENYYAFEIDNYAIKISSKNYPQIIQCGNVFDSDFKEYKGIDLLLGGSPCTYWSISKKNREITCDGEGFRLFLRYYEALKNSCPRYFLYENNYSIHKNIKAEISKYLGVEPIMINSALVSAQQRKRCYWTNIPNVTQPEDKGILLTDILESGLVWQEKSYCITANYHPTFKSNLEMHRNSIVALPVNTINGKAHTIPATYYKAGTNLFPSYGAENSRQKIAVKIGEYGKGGQGQRIYSVYDKSVTLNANGGGSGAKTGLYKINLPDGDYIIRKLYPVEAERLQTLPDNYTEGVSDTQRYKCIGNGWTVDVIAHILKNII